MGLRPAKCYRDKKGKPYTRKAHKVAKKAFIKGIPGSKIRIFDMGNKKKRQWQLGVDLVSKQEVQARHNQLESARTAVFRRLNRKVGRQNFYFRVRAYPHHVLRENSMATGAGADRFQQGMRNAFGKPVGLAARLDEGQPLMSVYIDDDQHIPLIKEAYNHAKNKLSGDYRIRIRREVGRV